jgi:cytochrome P450
MLMSAVIDWHPEDPATLADPYPIFARMRDEDPCHWSPRLRSWVLTRYDDIRSVCLDRGQQMSSDRLRPFFATLPGPETERIANIMRYLSLWMVFKDPPEHTRLRRLTSKVFHPKAMQAMRPQIEQIADHLLEQIGERDEFDFIAEFAGPLPCLVIMALLGVDRADLAKVKRLSDDMALFIGSSRTSAEKYETAEKATQEMAAFFRDLIGMRRAKPREDLITELVELRDGQDRLSDDELVATCILLLFAGHETTTNHIANGLLSLTRFPQEMRRLRQDPGLVNAAVEELLRFEGPSGAQVRLVGQPLEMHGKSLAKGDRIFIMLNSSNRDPRAFEQADQLILDRKGAPHLTFGMGMHMCLGFPLARTEGQVAFPKVLARFSEIEAIGSQTWVNSLVFRGMHGLQVRVKRA